MTVDKGFTLHELAAVILYGDCSAGSLPRMARPKAAREY